MSNIIKKSTNRLGLTEINTPTDRGLVDVVLVNGLKGNPYHTWTSTKKDDFWPGQHHGL